MADVNKFVEMINKNWNKLKAEDKKAKAQGKIVGRYISEPFADGAAVYKIVGETKTKVKIKVVTDIGDDWEIPYWGSEASIDKKYALNSIAHRDKIDELFKR